MSSEIIDEFPLFALDLVALPSELVPLHIFEPRYQAMAAHCLDTGSEFGIVWASAEGRREIACACAIENVLERSDDGRLNLLARGTRVVRIDAWQDHLSYPAGTVEVLADREDPDDPAARQAALEIYAQLVRRATDRTPDAEELGALDAYGMAATVDFGPEAKQGLLVLRSETARLRLVTRLLRAAIKRLDFVDRAQTRARSNGKVRFG